MVGCCAVASSEMEAERRGEERITTSLRGTRERRRLPHPSSRYDQNTRGPKENVNKRKRKQKKT